MKPDLSVLKEAWPHPFVARHDVRKFSRTYDGRTIANYDSKGIGPKGRIIIGRETCYPVEELIEWLEARSTKV